MTRNNNIFFNIIVPTKNRRETLEHTLKCIESQNYQNYQLIILDNNSTDGTENFIQNLSNKNIVYENSNKNLPMNENWERGLKFCTKGYVSVIGDDDGFFPNSFDKLNIFLKENKTEIVSWHSNTYYWPNTESYKKNDIELYFSESNKKFIKHSSHETLKKILEMNILYLEAPMIYNSVVDINLINRIKFKKKRDIFFSNGIPDVYSGMAFLLNSKCFYKVNFPVGLSGVSKSSGGALISKKDKSIDDIIANNKSLNITTVPPIPSYYLSILEPFNKLCEEFANANNYNVNFYRLKMRVMLEIKNETKQNYEFYVKELNLFLNKFKKKYSFYKRILIFSNLFMITFYPITNRVVIKLDKNTKNIYDASLEAQSKYEFFNKNKIAKLKMIDKKLLISNCFRKLGIYNIGLTAFRGLKIFT